MRQEVGAGGELVLCAPRAAQRATLWAEFGDASSEEKLVSIEAGRTHDVELPLILGSLPTGRLIGEVKDALTQKPIVAASVSISGRLPAAETNQRGIFVMSGVPVGGHDLSVQHLGYAPLLHEIMVTRGTTTEIEIGLVPDPVEMEPIVATATRSRRLEVKGFYERKYWGELVSGGTFFTVADIERRNPVLISHLIADLSGIRLDCGMRRDSCKIMNMRGSSGFSPGGCRMRIYLDGIPLGGGGRGNTVDNFVRPGEIAGVEVYKGPASLPAEFSGSDSRCGVVAIWTK